MVGVVVVMWLVVAHQQHPNTHHQVLHKTAHSSYSCWLFNPPKEENVVVMSEETTKDSV